MKREEAKSIVAAIVAIREIATDEMALEVPAIYPKWREGVNYEAGERVLHDDVLYKVLQAHASQAGWTPDATPSLFAKVLIPDANAIPEWEQPESTNGYMTGDKVTHDGKVYESGIDHNTHEPTEQNVALGIWKVVEVE